ncbi:release factor glutamine methyltransferase [Stackebrandtia albiflava]|uniref:Release factor glutamine methyltransferase n=1 Tax=Stackebrandtia albiflava TaxID=406432 RepID=A0A562V138_9ACTN|nr:methyltransferase [Stackebrandtia albiflava]TWJ11522.1 release factor glutamine methyltransferase [Stackebrandtia albiflava]
MTGSTHQPRMSPERAEWVLRWHEAGRDRAAERTGETTEYLGRTFTVPPDVMPITPVSHVLGEAVLAEVRPGDRVLDMGTGSGVNAVLAAGTAAEVLAVDVNPSAVATARANAARNGVADRVTVREGDCFTGIDGRFDLIVFDPPFRWFAPRDTFERAVTDRDYRTLTGFMEQVDRHLTDDGRVLLFFGSSGDLDYLMELVEASPLSAAPVAELTEDRHGYPVRYVTFRLTRPPA